MTENKRFTLKNWNDYAEGDCIYYDNGEEMGSLDVLDALNSLSKENEQLKSELRFLRDFRGFITEKNVENEQQRKGLQLQMLRLYNYFEDYFEDTMSPENFSEMWDIVKESEKWEKR